MTTESMLPAERIRRTEEFLQKTFRESPYLMQHPTEAAYRLEHSYRVANIGREIAVAEGFDVTNMVIACLLHDIAYSRELPDREARMAHGRLSAEIARPFLSELGLGDEEKNDILYGIAIHVDDVADFEWRRTPFAETVSDADNIDRFDAYRIYETLEYKAFSKLSLAEKTETVTATLSRLASLREMHLATPTAVRLWQERIDFYASFYAHLRAQLEASAEIR